MRGFAVVTAALMLVAGLSGPGTAASARDGRPLPEHLSVAPEVRQLVTVTSGRWSSTRGELNAWERHDDSWRQVRGPVTVRLGWSGWARAKQRRQGTGTTPAGRFAMPYAFGNRADPGTALRYRRLDSGDVWPYEPRDPATYNIFQPRRAPGSQWRPGYHERLASYGYEYAYAVVLGFNLPRDVHWSESRGQYVAREPADVRRGGGIFLHVQRSRHTAGCVAGPIADVRWLVRWLDPEHRPTIVMGPTAFVKRRL